MIFKRQPDQILRDRIAAAVKVDENGCWIWQKGLHDDGYASFWDGARTGQGHRISFEVFRGAIPLGLLALHTCDVRNCVSPFHLFLGTHADNTADMIAKGRRGTFDPSTASYGDRAGSRNNAAKLSDAAVAEIRSSSLPGAEIAALYSVTRNHVYRIRRGERWSHA